MPSVRGSYIDTQGLVSVVLHPTFRFQTFVMCGDCWISITKSSTLSERASSQSGWYIVHVCCVQRDNADELLVDTPPLSMQMKCKSLNLLLH